MDVRSILPGRECGDKLQSAGSKGRTRARATQARLQSDDLSSATGGWRERSGRSNRRAGDDAMQAVLPPQPRTMFRKRMAGRTGEAWRRIAPGPTLRCWPFTRISSPDGGRRCRSYAGPARLPRRCCCCDSCRTLRAPRPDSAKEHDTSWLVVPNLWGDIAPTRHDEAP